MRIKASQKDGSAVDRRADAAGLGQIRGLILHIAARRIYAHKSHRRTEAKVVDEPTLKTSEARIV